MSTRATSRADSVSIGGRSRRVIASFDAYGDAERAVDYMADRKLPVERVTIVGRDLKLVEQVTDRFGYAQAALQGALSGAVVGLLIGWLFAVLSWLDPEIAWSWLVVDGFLFGTLVGALLGLFLHALTRGRRDFASVPGVQAERYELLVDDDVTDEAARLLADSGLPASAGGSVRASSATG